MSDIKDESLLPKNRVESLCDGIFAIAMTIIILELKTPESLPFNTLNEDLPNTLIQLIPSIEAYILSFIVLGIFWLRHQIQFKYLKYVNRNILTINIFFLMLIVLVPFTSGLVMRFHNSRMALNIYILNLLLISSMLSIQGFYMKSNSKIRYEEVDDELIKKFLFLTGLPLIIFSLSFLMTFVNLRAAFLMIYLYPIFYIIFRMFKKKYLSNSNSPAISGTIEIQKSEQPEN